MSTVTSGDLSRSADVRSAAFTLSLGDRRIFSPELYPQILVDPEPVNRIGSLVRRIQIPRLGDYGFAAPSPDEDSAVATTAYTETSVLVTVARKSLGQPFAAAALDSDPLLMDPTLWESLLVSAGVDLTGALAAFGSGWTEEIGAAGTPLSLVSYLSAGIVLAGKNARGPYLAMLHSRQWGDLVNEHVLATGGAAAAQVSPVLGVDTGYRGMFLGHEVFVSNRVPLATGNLSGQMLSEASICMAQMEPRIRDTQRQASIGRVKLGYERDEPTDVDAYWAHVYYGLTRTEQARGVKLVSRA